jgi:tryptophan-rich sensory protein
MTATAHRRPIVIAALAAISVATLGATITDLGPWYQSLQEPAFKPPDILFGPAWTIIFALAALSGVLAWQGADNRAAREWIVGLFSLNGFLNILWSVLFFRVKRPDWALYEVGFLWLSIAVLIIMLARYSKWASILQVPYLAWVAFAGLLNWAVVRLNAPF